MHPTHQSQLDADDESESPLVAVVAGIVMTLVMALAFSLLALGFDYWWIAFPVGFGGLLPAAVGFVQWYASQGELESDAERERGEETTDVGDGALATLRDRYARGEIDEEEFERRLGALLETESLDDVRRYTARSRTPDSVQSRRVDPEFDVERSRV